MPSVTNMCFRVRLRARARIYRVKAGSSGGPTSRWETWVPPASPTSDPACHTDCREEQYPCTRLYSIHKPCKQCLNEVCFYR